MIDAFRDGATPEEIGLGYTSLSSGDVYQAYYLRNRDTVDEYLKQVRIAEDAARKTMRPAGIRWTSGSVYSPAGASFSRRRPYCATYHAQRYNRS
jgi:hypothetical protein